MGFGEDRGLFPALHRTVIGVSSGAGGLRAIRAWLKAGEAPSPAEHSHTHRSDAPMAAGPVALRA